MVSVFQVKKKSSSSVFLQVSLTQLLKPDILAIKMESFDELKCAATGRTGILIVDERTS